VERRGRVGSKQTAHAVKERERQQADDPRHQTRHDPPGAALLCSDCREGNTSCADPLKLAAGHEGLATSLTAKHGWSGQPVQVKPGRLAAGTPRSVTKQPTKRSGRVSGCMPFCSCTSCSNRILLQRTSSCLQGWEETHCCAKASGWVFDVVSLPSPPASDRRIRRCSSSRPSETRLS
jgi:hypothetical protein